MDAGHALRNWVQILHEFTAPLVQSPWFGDALGSFVGLLAILIGALYNARLNRRRDRELYEQEIASLRAAIGTELRCYAGTLVERFGFLDQASKEGAMVYGSNLTERLHIEPPNIYGSLAGRVGLLPSDQASSVVEAWHFFTTVHNKLRALAKSLEAYGWAAVEHERISLIIDQGFRAAVICSEAADDLIGPVRTIKVASQETAGIVLTSPAPGRELWRRYEARTMRNQVPK